MTKREVLEKLRMNEDDKNSPQYQATWIMIVNNKDNRTFVQEWVEMCTFEDFLLIKPTDEVSTQNSNFVRHSHDQSILSCLLKKNNIVPRVASKDDMSIIAAARNLSVFNFHESNLIYKTLKLSERLFIKFLNLFFSYWINFRYSVIIKGFKKYFNNIKFN